MHSGRIKVLMFGWEFPPVKSGGLGTACFGLTRGLHHQGVDVTFVLPHLYDEHCCDFVKLQGLFDRSNSSIKFKGVESALKAYQSVATYAADFHNLVRNERHSKNGPIYGSNLFAEVERYAFISGEIALEEDFDVIHSHDWMTYKAGLEAKRVTGKPLIIHVHATEFDRTGGNPNQYVYEIERAGMHGADKIITVSNFTKYKIIHNYGIHPDKIKVVHNAVEQKKVLFNPEHVRFGTEDKVVLFLGRITLQKGPDYFLQAAKRVLEFEPQVKFIFAGSGDMEAQMIRQASDMGLSKHVLFTGFLKGEDVDRAFQMADLYVMPSVSEPFGITPLESLINGTPVIISKQSGVSEVLNHCLKVDFWDIDQLTNKIVAVLRYQESLGLTMVEHGRQEVENMSWDNVGVQVKQVYEQLVA